jgi:hypothetical protein
MIGSIRARRRRRTDATRSLQLSAIAACNQEIEACQAEIHSLRIACENAFLRDPCFIPKQWHSAVYYWVLRMRRAEARLTELQSVHGAWYASA